MLFITLTLQATIYLNMIPTFQKDFEKNIPSSFQTKESQELDSLGLFIFKDKKTIKLLRFRETKIRRLEIPISSSLEA